MRNKIEEVVLMKRIKIFFMVFLLGVVFISKNNAFAMDEGLSMEKMPSEQVERFLKNSGITIFYSEPDKKTISCYDVNEDGMIAIGSDDSTKKQICIYSNNGDFQYGYRFKSDGSFEVEWKDNILNIYFVRSDVAVSLNSMGEIENVLEIQDTMENTTYWNTIVAANKKYVGKDEYIVQNDMVFLGWFATSYSQLIKVDAHGRTRLIYDVNSYQLLHSIIVFVGVCAWIGYVIWKLFGEFKKLQENKEEP